MSEIEKNLLLLGNKVKDKITNRTGLVENVSFDLYGCIQCSMADCDKDGIFISHWYDVSRVEIKKRLIPYDGKILPVWECINNLGKIGEDVATDLKGVVSSVCCSLYSDIPSCILTPMGEDNPYYNKSFPWIPQPRINILGENRVMEIPNFENGYIAQGKKGCDIQKSIPCYN